jgi:ABC-type antimicrobial peptide transport system permease subunit
MGFIGTNIKEEFRVENIARFSVFFSLFVSLVAALVFLSVYNGKGNALIVFFLFFSYFFLLFSSWSFFGFAFLSGSLTVLLIPYKLTSRSFTKLTRLLV